MNTQEIDSFMPHVIPGNAGWVVPRLEPPTGDLNADADIWSNWCQQMLLEGENLPMRLIDRYDVTMSANLFFHHHYEVMRCPKAHFFQRDGNGEVVQKWLVNRLQPTNRFFFLMLVCYNCAGRSYVNGRQTVSPRYFVMTDQHRAFCNALLKVICNRGGRQFLMHANETFETIFHDTAYATFNEKWRKRAAIMNCFWTPGDTYVGRVCGPPNNFLPFYRVINYEFY